MIDIAEIFKGKELDVDKLLTYGFKPAVENGFTREFGILDDEYVAMVHVTDSGNVSFNVFDDEGEEYLPARMPNARGAFVGQVHLALKEILKSIANECFHTEHFEQDQTKRMLALIKERYGSEPEFLWKSLPECAALRMPGKKPWFAVVGRVAKNKFGIDEEGVAEVINLKDDPEKVRQRIASGVAHPAYHMNKQHWYTLFLDDRLTDDQIATLLEASYDIVNA